VLVALLLGILEERGGTVRALFEIADALEKCLLVVADCRLELGLDLICSSSLASLRA
jgi:hypothetical protein